MYRRCVTSWPVPRVTTTIRQVTPLFCRLAINGPAQSRTVREQPVAIEDLACAVSVSRRYKAG